MKNKIKMVLVSVCILSSLILCSCEKKTETSEEYEKTKDKVLGIFIEKDMEKRTDEAVNFETKDKNEYNVEQIKVKSAKALSGIAILNDNMLLSDVKKDCIYVTDYQGRVLNTIGKSGNGKLEFIKPNNIKVFGDKVYILDSGNFRVQILDRDLNYLDEIKFNIKKDIKKSDPEFSMSKMCVDDNGIYMNGRSLSNNDKIYYYGFDDRKIKPIGYNFHGPMAGYKNGVLAINTLAKTYDKKSDFFSAHTGNNFLLDVRKDKDDLKIIKELPYGMGITDFMVDDACILALSESYRMLCKYDIYGNYINGLAYIKMTSEKDYNFNMAGDKDTLFVTDGIDETIQILRKK